MKMLQHYLRSISVCLGHVLTHTEDHSQFKMFIQVLHISRGCIVCVTDEYKVVPASAIIAKSPALRGNFLPEEHLDLVNLKQNELEQIDGTENRRRLKIQILKVKQSPC